jgi:5-methylcytosine-specific restriction endonuclease McrA
LSGRESEVVALYVANWHPPAIAVKFGVSKGAVYNILRREGVRLRTKSESMKLLGSKATAAARAANIGKPSHTLGKRWKVGHRVFKPTTRGPNHYRWTGLTPLTKSVRVLPEYIRWRTAVFQRDGRICQECGAKGGHSTPNNADHIIPLSKILHDHSIKTTDDAVACAAMWDISNGRTLCIDCHKKTDSWGLKSVARRWRDPATPKRRVKEADFTTLFDHVDKP